MRRFKNIRKFVLVSFALCALFLLVMGKLFRSGYEKMSVIVNLYIQGTLLLLAGFLPFIAALVNICESPTFVGFLMAVGLLFYASIYVVGYIWLLRHYHQPYRYAFELCVTDLRNLSARMKMSYEALNLVIFVIWWLGLLSANVVLMIKIIGM